MHFDFDAQRQLGHDDELFDAQRQLGLLTMEIIVK